MALEPVPEATRGFNTLMASQAERLDQWGRAVQGSIASAFRWGGSSGQQAKNALNGVWLGHPLHPALTDVPIGAWVTTLVCDLLGIEQAADAALSLGVAAAVPTALAGAADWVDAADEPRRVGLVHAVLNVVALLLFVGSIAAGRAGKRAT